MKKIYALLSFIFAVAFQMEVAAQSFVPQAGQFYTIRLGGADGLLFGRAPVAIDPAGDNDLMKSRLRNADPAEAQLQTIKFEPADVEGEYYIVNGNGEYLYNNTWNMWFHAAMDPTLTGSQKGYKFKVIDSPNAPGLYRIGTVSYGTANRVIGAAATTENSLTYADKKETAANLNWAITPAAAAATPKKVAYVTTTKTSLAETAAPTSNDPLIRMLTADPNIDLTVHEVAGNATVDLSGYDAVIAQESFSSSADIFKPGGSLALASIPVPFIFNKSYALRSTGAIPGGTGAPAEAGGTAITVATANQTNDLFKGLTFVNDTVQIFNTTSDDNGNPGIKSFNYSAGVTISNPNTLLATHAGITNPQTTVFINDIPAGTSFGPTGSQQTLQARMIAIGMNFGAMVKDNGANWTASGLTLWRNAVYSLVGLPVPSTLVNPNVVTSLAAETRNASFNLAQNYPNPSNGSTTIEFELKKASHITLEVYDITGKRVALLAEGLKSAGVHEVKLNNNLNTGIYFYKLSADGATATRKMVITR